MSSVLDSWWWLTTCWGSKHKITLVRGRSRDGSPSLLEAVMRRRLHTTTRAAEPATLWGLPFSWFSLERPYPPHALFLPWNPNKPRELWGQNNCCDTTPRWLGWWRQINWKMEWRDSKVYAGLSWSRGNKYLSYLRSPEPNRTYHFDIAETWGGIFRFMWYL